MDLQTHNLKLVPLSPQHYLALLDGLSQFNQSFGIPAAEGFRDFCDSGEVSADWIAQLRIAKGPDPWTHGFAAVHRIDQLVIGSLCFKGPPNDEGMVEIAYGFVPNYQGRGFATESTKALMEWAWLDPKVKVIRAHTKGNNNASARVLNKLGFASFGEVIEPEDGLVWCWERNRPS